MSLSERVSMTQVKKMVGTYDVEPYLQKMFGQIVIGNQVQQEGCQTKMQSSLHHPGVVLVSDSQASEQGQVLGLALLDLVHNPEGVSDCTQTLHRKGGYPAQFHRTGLLLAQSHQSQGEPLVVCRYHSRVLELVQKGVNGSIRKTFRGALGVAAVEGNSASSGCFCLEGEGVAGREGSLVSLVVIRVDPDIRQVLQHPSLDPIFDLVQDTGRYFTARTCPSHSLYVAFILQIDLGKFPHRRDHHMDMPAPLRQVSALDDPHLQLVIDAVVRLQVGQQLVLDAVDRVVQRVVSETVEVHVESCLAGHCDQEEVLQVIGDAAIQSAVEVQFNSFVVGDHAGVQFEYAASLGDHDFAPVADGGDEFEEVGLFGEQSRGVVVQVDVFEQQILFCDECAQDLMPEDLRFLFDEHQQQAQQYIVWMQIENL